MTTEVKQISNRIEVSITGPSIEDIENNELTIYSYSFTYFDADKNEFIMSSDFETEIELDEFDFQQEIYNNLLEKNPQYASINISLNYDWANGSGNAEVFAIGYNISVITVEEWEELLKNKTIFNEETLKVLNRMKNFRTPIDSSTLSRNYGGSILMYGRVTGTLVEQITKIQNLNIEELTKPVAISYVFKKIKVDIQYNDEYILTPNLSRALDKIDLSNIKLYEDN